MGATTKFTIAFLTLTVLVILGALVVQASQGPTFRAADYANMNECIQNIPTEWVRGSLEYDGAETSCFYTHRPDQR
jgi:hypothetical protein